MKVTSTRRQMTMKKWKSHVGWSLRFLFARWTATVCAIVFFLLFFFFGHRVHDMLAGTCSYWAQICCYFMRPLLHLLVSLNTQVLWIGRAPSTSTTMTVMKLKNHTFFTWSWIISFNQFHAQRPSRCRFWFLSVLWVDVYDDCWYTLDISGLGRSHGRSSFTILDGWSAHHLTLNLEAAKMRKFFIIFPPSVISLSHLVEREITSLSLELCVQPRCVIC